MLAPPPDISLRDERIHLLLAGSELSLALLSLDARVHVSAGLEALKREPPVMRTLEKWWEWVPRPQSYMMETASFLSLNALLYEHLVPELCAANPHGAWRAAEVDWVAAGGSEGAINFSQFSNTLLTLADNFSPGGSEPEVLVEFLNGLLARMKARLDREAARPESVEEEPTGSTEQALTSIHEDDDVLADVLLFSQPRRTKQRPSSGVRARFVGPDDAGRSEEVMEQGQERDAMLLSSRRLVTSAGRRPPLGGPGHLLRRSSSGDMVMNLELAMGAIARQDTRRKSRVFLNPSSSATMNVGLSQLGKPGAQARGTRRQHIASDSLRPASAMERPLSAASVDLRPASASPGQSYPVRVRPTTAGIVRRPPQSKAAGKAERPQSALSSGPQRPHSAMESAADTEMGVEAAEQGGVHARPRTAVGYQHPGEVGLQPAARAVRNNSVVAAAALATASGDAASPSSPSAGISSLLREISGSSSSQSWSQGGGSTTVSPFPAKAHKALGAHKDKNVPPRRPLHHRTRRGRLGTDGYAGGCSHAGDAPPRQRSAEVRTRRPGVPKLPTGWNPLTDPSEEAEAVAMAARARSLTGPLSGGMSGHFGVPPRLRIERKSNGVTTVASPVERVGGDTPGGEGTKAALQKDASTAVGGILMVRYVPAWSLATTATHKMLPPQRASAAVGPGKVPRLHLAPALQAWAREHWAEEEEDGEWEGTDGGAGDDGWLLGDDWGAGDEACDGGHLVFETRGDVFDMINVSAGDASGSPLDASPPRPPLAARRGAGGPVRGKLVMGRSW